jgi:hypothetical protein
MTPRLRFFVNRDAIAQHLEASALRRNEIDRRNRKSLANFGRQTGGPRFIVSEGAVFDRDLHCWFVIGVIEKPARIAA